MSMALFWSDFALTNEKFKIALSIDGKGIGS
jgi:hypothetical protein